MASQEVKKLLSKFNLDFKDFEKNHLPDFESKIESFYKESEVNKYIVSELLKKGEKSLQM